MKKSFKELINSDTPVFVDFYAQWCGPCKAMAPALEKLSTVMGDKINVIKIDIDKNPDAANAYKVQAVPTLIIFQNGEVKWRQSGALSLGEMQKAVQPFISKS